MIKLQGKRKILIAVLTCILIFCLGIGAISCANARSSSLENESGTALDAPEEQTPGAQKQFTFGQTYTIGGKEYKLGGAEGECIDFYTALGKDSDEYDISLTSFTRPDGTDATAETTAVQHAGTYVLEVQSRVDAGDSEIATIAVNSSDIILDINFIPEFYNAGHASFHGGSTNGMEGYRAHGDYLTIYHANDGWYTSKNRDDIFIESKVITNAYYYMEGAEGNRSLKTIAIGGEYLSPTGGTNTPESSTITLPISKESSETVSFNISKRSGISGRESQEYIAIFKFDALSDLNYTVKLGDELKDEFRWVEIIPSYTNGEFDGSFTVTKHWWILGEGQMFVDEFIKPNNDEPYTPFGFGPSVASTADEGTFEFVNTINYNDLREISGVTDTAARGIQVRVPAVVLTTSASRTDDIYFSIQYTSVDGETRMLSENAKLSRPVQPKPSSDVRCKYTFSGVSYTDENSLAYYFNYTMPAGTYVLTLFGVEAGKTLENSGTVMMSEYTLYVKPIEFDASEIYEVRSQLQDEADGSWTPETFYGEIEYGKTYPNKLHNGVTTSFVTLNAERLGFWKNVKDGMSSAFNDAMFYDADVTLKYNRRVWGSTQYVTYEQMLGPDGDLTTPKEYTFYYSISAKNYITKGGPNDADRLSYVFNTTISSTYDEIYKYIKDSSATESDYFGNVAYTGSKVYPTVYTSSDYSVSYPATDSVYTNVTLGKSDAERPYITLTLTNSLVSWADPMKLTDHSYPKDGSRVKIDDSHKVLTIYYDIAPVQNSFALAPSLPTWTYRAFNANVNVIKSMLTFPGAETYYRLGTVEDGNYTWVDVGTTVEWTSTLVDNVGTNADRSWFQVDASGKITTAGVADKLKSLPADTYVLASYVANRADGNVTEYAPSADSFPQVIVSPATNRWTTTPSLFGWVYKSFSADNFTLGVDYFSDENGAITYSLYRGSVSIDDGGNVTGNSVFTDVNFKGTDGMKDAAALEARFADLTFGNYTLVATRSASGNNYAALVHPIPFSVSIATNTWKSGQVPQIGGWTYGQFTSDLFSAGAANFGVLTFVVQNVNGDVVDTESSVLEFKLSGDVTEETIEAALGKLPVGKYNLRAYVDETDNYTKLEQNTRFTVSIATNAWVEGILPSIQGWTYGTYDGETVGKLTEGTPVHDTRENPATEELVVYEYYPAAFYGGDWQKDGELVTDLAKAPAGDYILIATVRGNNNYDALKHTVYFVITKQDLAWQNNCAPESGLSWTWGDWVTGSSKLEGLTASGLVQALAQGKDTGLKTLDYTITYSIRDTSDNSSTPIVIEVTGGRADKQALIAELSRMGAGTYEITVTVTEKSKNYNSLTATTSVTILEASFDWHNVPTENVTFDWDDKNTDKQSELELHEPYALNVDGGKILLTFTVSAPSFSGSRGFDSFGALVKFFIGTETEACANAGVYTIVVGAKDGEDEKGHAYKVANYAAFDVSFTVVVNQALNAWKEGKAPKTHYEIEYADLEELVIVPSEAKHGTVQYYSDASLIVPIASNVKDLKEWIMQMSQTLWRANDDEPYYFYVAVQGTANYAGIDVVTISLLLKTTPSAWDNAEALQEVGEPEYNFIYSKSLLESQVKSTIVLPMGVEANGTTKYTVNYNNHNSTKNETQSFDGAESSTALVGWLTKHLNGDLAAGAYEITAVYTPDEKHSSFSTLTYTLTINIARATPEWDDEFTNGAYYSDSYRRVSVPDPALKAIYSYVPMTITVTNNGTSQAENYVGPLSEFVTTLNVGSYTVVVRVEETDNYEGLSKSCQIAINTVNNVWKSDAPSDAEGTSWSSGYTWTFTRTEAYASITIPEATEGNEALVITLNDETVSKAELDSKIKALPANASGYALTFEIKATGNYFGVTSECRIIINKAQNSWTSDELSNYPASGSVSSVDLQGFFHNLTAAVGNDLLRFDIVQVGGKTVRTDLNMEDFENELKKLANGSNVVYTITARIGGTGYGDDFKEQAALEAYNADYEPLVSTCTITLTPSTNGWTNSDKLLNASWTWHKYESGLVQPIAIEGNDAIVYVITKGNATVKTITAGSVETSDAAKAFEAFVKYLTETAEAGSYNVTISIAASNTYGAADSLTRTYTINKVQTAWSEETNTNAPDGKTYNWTYTDGSYKTTELIEPVSGDWSGEITFKLTKSGMSGQLYSGSTWKDLLAEFEGQTAGTYTITAYIEGDANHTELNYTVTVEIARAANGWQDGTSSGTIEWTYGDWTHGDFSGIKFLPNHGSVGNVTVNGNTVAYDSLNTWLQERGVGEYYITVTVAADDRYTELTGSVNLTITRAKNSWVDKKYLTIAGWTWGSAESIIEEGISFPVAAQGASAMVTVTNKSGETVVEASIAYQDENRGRTYNGNDLTAFVRRLGALNVVEGGYLISVTVYETVNFAELKGDPVPFMITKTPNGWKVKPGIAGWNYGGDVVYPSGTPNFGEGTVEFKYAKVREDDTFLNGERTAPSEKAEWSTKLGSDAGEYWLWAHVEGTDNYEGLDTYVTFTINQGSNEWVTAPGVIAWSWNNYDRKVNVFSGSSRSDGKATFKITRKEGVTNALDLTYFMTTGTTITAGDINVLFDGFQYEYENFVSEDVAKVLNALKPGTYLLTVKIAASGNFGEAEADTQFTVGKPLNGWERTPSVRYYSYNEKNVFTAGKPTYESITYYESTGSGTITSYTRNTVVHYQIKGQPKNGTTYTGKDVTDTETLIEELFALPVGSYTLYVWIQVDSDKDPFTTSYTSDTAYQAAFSVSSAYNSWTTEGGQGASDLSAYYEVLHDTYGTNAENWKTWLIEPKATAGTAVYVLYELTNDRRTAVAGDDEPLSYEELIKAVMELSSGKYIVSITVAADNYYDMTKDITVSINRYSSRIVGIPEDRKLTGMWKQEGDEPATTIDEVEGLKAEKYYKIGEEEKVVGELTIVYTLQGYDQLKDGVYYSFDELKTACKVLPKGSYQVILTVAVTNGYEEVTETLQLDISAAENDWVWGGGEDSGKTDAEKMASTFSSVDPDDEEEKKSDVEINEDGDLTWTWGHTITWDGFLPLYGYTIRIEIAGADEATQSRFDPRSFTISINATKNDQGVIVRSLDTDDLARVNRALSSLGYGKYTMTVTVPVGSDSNWGDIVDNALARASTSKTTMGIVVKQDTNVWKNAPAFNPEEVEDLKEVEGEEWDYEWPFGTTGIKATYLARHGADPAKDPENNTAVIRYYVYDLTNKSYDSEAPLSGMPTDIGTYIAVISVPETLDYEGIAGTADGSAIIFKINRADNTSFDVRPSVSNWTWGNYSKTANMFRGRPSSGGDVQFEILDKDGAKVLISRFYLVTAGENGSHSTTNFEENIYAPNKVIEELNKLTEGDYILRVIVAENGNYNGFIDDDTPFSVNIAENQWDIAPQVSPWSRYEWNNEEYMPQAAPRYGSPILEIRSKVSDELYFRAVYTKNSNGGWTYNVETNKLDDADAGWYTLVGWVEGEEGKYTGLTKYNFDFQIFIQGSPDDANFWEIVPSIESWVAAVNSKDIATFNIPTGKPVRGKVYFEFFKVNADMSQGAKIGEGVDSTTISKNAQTYYLQDFYIPTKPGIYYMYAHAVNGSVESDSLDSDRIMLTIGNRDNTWEQSVNIASVLELGNRDNWVLPSAKANLWDSTYRYEYFNAETRTSIGNQIPTEPGKYFVRAYANARYSEEIYSDMDFEVRLSKNYWENDTSPTIEGWSEEYNSTSPNPVGKAMIGATIYTYVNVKTGEILTSKPTEAGHYILIARAALGEADGYEVLESSYEFTIEPAFDNTLLMICICLGTIASALAVVAIIFAIRRYRENG